MVTRPTVRFLATDIFDAPDNGKRYEVINGDLYVTTAPDLDHQRPISALLGHIWPYLKLHPIGKIFTSPVGLILDDENGIQPDLVYVSRERASILQKRGIFGTPDMVAEVLSPSTEGRDRGIKMRRFAAAGIAHYWLIDPDKRTVEAYRLGLSGYALAGTIGAGDVFRPEWFPGLEIPIADLWL